MEMELVSLRQIHLGFHQEQDSQKSRLFKKQANSTYEAPSNKSIPFLYSISPIVIQEISQEKVGCSVFIAAWFVIMKLLKQLKCLLAKGISAELPPHHIQIIQLLKYLWGFSMTVQREESECCHMCLFHMLSQGEEEICLPRFKLEAQAV